MSRRLSGIDIAAHTLSYVLRKRIAGSVAQYGLCHDTISSGAFLEDLTTASSSPTKTRGMFPAKYRYLLVQGPRVE
ncbi:hypothetical protein FOXYSP1_02069 [Fusarium oxysporum f. sp. phaseoli]